MPLSGSHNVGDPNFIDWANLVDTTIGALQGAATSEATARAAGDTAAVATAAADATSKANAAQAASQPLDADLTTIGGLNSAAVGVIVSDGAGWLSKNVAAFKTWLGLTKSDVGLGSVDNTADTAKPVSTAQQTALDLKANLASPALTGTPTAPTATAGTNTTQVATTAFVTAATGTSASFAEKGAWTTTTAYVVGDVVTQGGVRYIAKTAHTSGTFATDLAAAKWTSLDAGAALSDAGLWAASTAYTAGQIVTMLQTRYVCTTAHTSGATFSTTNWAPLGDAPTIRAMEGIRLVGYGTSYMLGSNAAQPGFTPSGSVVSLGGMSTLDKLGARLHSSFVINCGQSSTWAQEVVGNLYGGGNSIGSGKALRGANGMSTSQGAVVVGFAENDIFSGTANAQHLVSLDNSIQAIYRLVKGGTLTDDQSWSTPFTSTADVWCSSQHYGETTTQNASTSTTFTGTSCTVVLIGYSDSTGGTAQVQVDGSTVATVNLSNQAVASAVRSRVQVPVYVSGLTNASHTVAVTKTDATGTKVGVDCLIQPNTTYPNMLILLKPAVDANSHLATVNTQINTSVTALGGANAGFVVVDPAVTAYGWDEASMTLSSHPNDKGHAHYVNRILDECTRAGVTWAQGLNRLT